MSKKIEITEETLWRIERFWRWVRNNHERFLGDKDCEEWNELMYDLGDQIMIVSVDLGYRLKRAEDLSVITIHFSVDGRRHLVPLAEAMVSGFPNLPGWQAKALYLPADDLSSYRNRTDEPLKFWNMYITISRLKYRVRKYDIQKRKMYITIYDPDYEIYGHNPFFGICIDTAVRVITGEMLFFNNLVICGHEQLTTDHIHLPPVYELAEKLQELKVIRRTAGAAVRRLMKGI